MTEIMTLGEVLIDLTQVGSGEGGTPHFAAFPGGAPANVAVAASRLGAKTGFIGKTGRDEFGKRLKKVLEEEKVLTRYLFETDGCPTTLAVVSVSEQGERSFSFYRDPGADTLLTEDEALQFLREEPLPEILHFGSLSLTSSPSREAALSAVREARKRGVLISYDPNYRPALWPDEETAVSWMKAPLDQVDILKVSDEELPLLTGEEDPVRGSLALARYGCPLVLVTMGSRGVFYRFGECCGSVGSVPVTACDTNGAGDTFLGAVLSRLTGSANGQGPVLKSLSETELQEILAFANRAAARTCMRAGAIPAMPYLGEMDERP